MRGRGEGAIYRDGRGLWTAVVELPPGPDGKRRRKVIRSKTKATVLEKLRATQADKSAAGGDLPTSSQTVEQWFRYWLTLSAREVAPNTLSGYRSAVLKHVIPAVGGVQLSKLTPAHVRRVHDYVMDALGLSSTTALLAHRVMSVALKVAEREGRIARNPASLVDAPRKAVTHLDVLSLEEALDVLEHLKDEPLGARWATSLLTGARRGEVIGLERSRVGDDLDFSWQLQRVTWEHGCKTPCGRSRGADCPARRHTFPADFEQRSIDGGLFWTRPKSRAGWRIIPLVDPLRGMLEQHKDFTAPNQWDLMFDLNGRPLDPDDDSARWREVLLATGIDKDVRLHDLRHTTVDLLYLAGVDEDLIPDIVGHSTRAQSRAYRSKANRARMLRAMESMSSLFSSRDRDTRPASAE